MASGESVEISQFTITVESRGVEVAREENPVVSWADETAVDNSSLPDTIRHLINNGVRFKEAPFWSNNERPRLVKNLSVYFSVDTVVTRQAILEAFDSAGIDIDDMTGIQRKSSNRTWVVSFDSQLAKETALEEASIQLAGATMFLGDCENRLVLVKIYEAPSELPDTALIGRLSHYGSVLSFRQDKVAQFIDNGIRTARMRLNRHIPSIVKLAGEFVRVWYPNQPKTCRNCGSEDHLVKDCQSFRCFNCECPGHHAESCDEPQRCSVCMADDHQLTECPYVQFSANVEVPKGEQSDEEKAKEKKREKEKYRVKMDQAKHKQQELEKEQERMQMEGEKMRHVKEKGREKDKEEDKDRNKSREQREQREQRGEKREQRRSTSHKERHCEKSEDERERRERKECDAWREKRRDRDREYPQRDYHRDRSSRREYYSDEDDGWTHVSYKHRRRYDY